MQNGRQAITPWTLTLFQSPLQGNFKLYYAIKNVSVLLLETKKPIAVIIPTMIVTIAAVLCKYLVIINRGITSR